MKQKGSPTYAFANIGKTSSLEVVSTSNHNISTQVAMSLLEFNYFVWQLKSRIVNKKRGFEMNGVMSGSHVTALEPALIAFRACP